jgi:hypothetical protein
VPVTYRASLPDLFKEGKGVVAQGKLEADGEFRASDWCWRCCRWSARSAQRAPGWRWRGRRAGAVLFILRSPSAA